MRKIKFGIRIPASGPASSAQRLVESTLAAEELGYDMVLTLDHIHNSFERHMHHPVGMGSYEDKSNTLEPNNSEPVSTFSYLAGMTKKIQFAAGIMSVLFRDPTVLAKEIATLDNLSNGRFIMGVGVSNITKKEEFLAVGKPFKKYEERYKMLGEYVGAMKAIWENKSASYHGEYVNFDDLVVYPKPVRKPNPPIWVGCYTLSGGINRPAVKFAVEHADGWIYGYLMTPETLDAMISDFKLTSKAAGRGLANFAWCFQIRASIGVSESEARKYCEWIPKLQGDMSRYSGYMRKKKENWRKAEGAKAAPDSILESSVIGTGSKISKTIEQFVNAGANHFDISFMYPRYEDLVRQMKLFARQCLPSF